MALKLKIGSFIDAPVKLVVRDGSRDVPFTLTLVLRRLSQEEALRLVERLQRMAEPGATLHDGASATREMLMDIITDWRDQRLVLGEDDKPAPYSPEALDLLLSLAGAAPLLLQSVLRAVQTGVREEERDRRGN